MLAKAAAGACDTNLIPFDGAAYLRTGFVGADEQEKMLITLTAEQSWQQPDLKLFGRIYKTPRLVAWCGERDYTYSGHTHKAAPLTPALQQLWPRVEQATAARFNTVLLNYYRTGQDSMGWHADDEPELGRNPVIASLSLGAARRFKLRHNQSRAVVDIELPAGSLLVMAGALQHHWQHCLPKSVRVDASRLNLTFRWIYQL